MTAWDRQKRDRDDQDAMEFRIREMSGVEERERVMSALESQRAIREQRELQRWRRIQVLASDKARQRYHELQREDANRTKAQWRQAAGAKVA